MEEYLSGFADIETITPAFIKNYLINSVIETLMLSLPFLFLAAVLAILFVVAQTKLNFSWESLKPNFSKINPIKGLKNLVTLRSLADLIKSMVKIMVISAVVYTEIKANISGFILLIDKSILASLAWLSYIAFGVVIKITICLVAFGILDYLYQRWDYERKNRMSFQEVKDEFKQTEGDPQLKGRLRERQRRMAMLRIAQQVPLANVVIKNPTHFAVAIKYDSQTDKAPKVIAKGQDYLALKIIELAEANHIVVTANPPLARGLFEAVELDQEIPEKYYQAVAEVLVFVYEKMNGSSGNSFH